MSFRHVFSLMRRKSKYSDRTGGINRIHFCLIIILALVIILLILFNVLQRKKTLFSSYFELMFCKSLVYWKFILKHFLEWFRIFFFFFFSSLCGWSTNNTPPPRPPNSPRIQRRQPEIKSVRCMPSRRHP